MDKREVDKRAVILNDGTPYLEVKYRIMDFRMKYPAGRIQTELINYGDAWACMKASVYSDMKCENIISEAYSLRRFTEQDPAFMEVAETIAIGRALSDAGFNLPSQDLMEEPDATRFQQMMDDGTVYLPVSYRVAWVRKDRPGVYIKKTLVNLQENYAVVKVEVIDDGNILADAHARRAWRDDDAGQFFLESAETAAVGRALSILGYDLPPGLNRGNDITEGHGFAEMSYGRKFSEDEGVNVPPYQRNDESGFPATQPVQDDSPSGFFPVDSWMNPGQASEPSRSAPQEEIPFDQYIQEYPEFSFGQSPQTQPYAAPGPVQTGMFSVGAVDQKNWYEEAAAKVIPFGQYTGKRMGDVLNMPGGKEYLDRLANTYRGDPGLVNAAQTLLRR